MRREKVKGLVFNNECNRVDGKKIKESWKRGNSRKFRVLVEDLGVS